MVMEQVYYRVKNLTFGPSNRIKVLGFRHQIILHYLSYLTPPWQKDAAESNLSLLKLYFLNQSM